MRLGRMVEQNRSGSFTEIDYAPTGAQLQLLNGQNAVTDFVPLASGATAVYTAQVGGLAYYRRSDWLGSSRLASTPNRTVYYDGAYGPFGEPYAQSGTTDLSFTGVKQDTASNVYDFPAREYGIQGRWPSPDPADLAAVNPMDPQTWNRYAYVRNSPLELFDPLGLCGGPDTPTYNSTGQMTGVRGSLPCPPSTGCPSSGGWVTAQAQSGGVRVC